MWTTSQALLERHDDPDLLVEGDPRALTALSEQMADTAQRALDANTGLTSVELGYWTGQAADAYRERLVLLSERLLVVAHAHAAAAAALSDHATIVLAARESAATASRWWRLGAPEDDGPAAPLGPPALTPQRASAVSLLDEARQMVTASAGTTAQILSDAADLAPRERSVWDHVGFYWSEFWQGAAESTRGLADGLYGLSPLNALVDHGDYLTNQQALLAALWAAIHDPVQAGKDALDWETWKDSPARALGHLTPDAVAGLGTSGVGAAGVAGARIATRGARAAADLAGDSLTVAERAELKIGRFTEDELATPTPGTGPVIFRPRFTPTAEEVGQLITYARAANAARLDGGLSATGRVSTAGALQREATRAARRERARALAAGDDSYRAGHVAGHGPDSTWVGEGKAYVWIPQTPRLNSSLGGQASGAWPVGHVPTIFQVELPDGTLYPLIRSEESGAG